VRISGVTEKPYRRLFLQYDPVKVGEQETKLLWREHQKQNVSVAGLRTGEVDRQFGENVNAILRAVRRVKSAT
jgi:hypothetical protein